MKIKQVTQPTVKKLNNILNQMSNEFTKDGVCEILLSKSVYKKLCRELHYKLKNYKGYKFNII